MRRAMFAAMVIALAAQAGNVAALDTSRSRPVRVQGLPEQIGYLGAWSLTALGVNGPFCDYLVAWTHPTNSNAVAQCVLHERTTPFGPGCIANEGVDIVTFVQAGDGAVPVDGGGGLSGCTGFDIKGEVAEHVSLMLSESPLGLWGTALMRVGPSLVLYPVGIA